MIAGLLLSNFAYTQSCTGPLSVSIPGSGTAMPLAILPSSTVQNLTCSGVADGGITVDVNGGTSTYTYSWSDNPTINSNVRTGLSAGSYTCWVTDAHACTQQQTFNVSGVPVALTASSNAPLCTGGTLNLTATGSNLGNFVWTSPSGTTYPVQNASIPSATPAQSGTWTVTWTSATNPSCNATSTVNAFVGPITLGVTPNPTINTQATALVSNCTSPYTVYWRTLIAPSWSSAPSVSNSYTISGLMPATAYMAYAVDANGATTSIVYFITSGVPFCGNSPTVQATVACDKVLVDWGGGNLLDINGNPYTQWVAQIQRVSPTLGPVVSAPYTSNTSCVFPIPASGFGATYQVTVSGMCNNQYSIYSAPVQVAVPDPRPLAPTLSPASFTIGNCAGTTKTMTVTWAPSGTGPAALGGWRVRRKLASSTGNYGIGASTTNPSTTSLSFTVAANATYKVYVEPVGCSNLTGTPSQVYLVTGCVTNGNATLTTIRPEAPDPDDLTADELNEGVNIVLEAGISVYPNPNNGAFTVSISDILGNIALVEVVNMMGQVVYSEETKIENGNLKHDINLDEQLAQGAYLVKVTTPQDNYQTKIVKF